jgi:hypothetical protein
MGSNAVDDAVRELGRYFGIRSADAYLSQILGADTDILDPTKATVPSTGRALLLSKISGASDESFATTKAMFDYIAANKPLEGYVEDICITPDRSDTYANQPVNRPEVKSGKVTYKEQGVGKPGDGKVFSINDIRDKDQKHKGDSSETPVNVIQVFPATGNVANADSAVAALFLTSVSTLEMSRAVPYIDILMITSEDEDNTLKEMSLGRWLLGPTSKDKSNVLTADFSDYKSVTTKIDDDVKRTEAAAAAMEIFTSPQTLINMPTGPLTNDPFRPFMSLEELAFNVAGAGGMFSFKSGEMKIKLHDKAKLGSITPLVTPGGLGSIKLAITYGWSHPDGKSHERKSDANASNRVGELIDAMRITEIYMVHNSEMTFEDNGEVSINAKIAMVGGNEVSKIDITLPSVVRLATRLDDVFKDINKMLRGLRESRGTAVGQLSKSDTLDAATNLNSALNISAKDVRALLAWTHASRRNKDIKEIGTELRKLFTSQGKKKGNLANLTKTRDAALDKIIQFLKKSPDPWLRSPKGMSVSRGYVSLGKIISVFVGESLKSTNQFSEVQLVFHAFNDSASFMQDFNIAQFPIQIAAFQTVIKEKFSKRGSMTVQSFLSILETYFISDVAANAYGMNSLYDTSGKQNTTEARANRKLRSTAKAAAAKGLLNDQLHTIWKKAYGITGDNATGLGWRKPEIMANIQAAPQRDALGTGKINSAKTVLKIQFFDQQCRTTETLRNLFIEFADSGITTAINRAPTTGCRGSRHQENFTNQLKFLETDLKLITKINLKSKVLESMKLTKTNKKLLDDISKNSYVINIASYKNLKDSISKIVPVLYWGSGAGSLMSAAIKTQSNSALTTVNMLRNSPGKSKDEGNVNVPTTIMPTALSIDTMGCPYISYGQQFFVDMDTNSTADNFYGVSSVNHTIGPDGFKTSIELIQLDAYGRFRSTFDSASMVALNLYLVAERQMIADEEKKKKMVTEVGTDAAASAAAAT